MSVTFTVVRLVEAHQVLFLAGEPVPSFYKMIELVSWGWESGARSRVKKLSLDKALGYINKLHIGGWIDDAEYHRVYQTVDTYLWHVKSESPNRAEDLAYLSYQLDFPLGSPPAVKRESIPFEFENLDSYLLSKL